MSDVKDKIRIGESAGLKRLKEGRDGMLDGNKLDAALMAALKIIKDYAAQHSVQHPLPTKEK